MIATGGVVVAETVPVRGDHLTLSHRAVLEFVCLEAPPAARSILVIGGDTLNEGL